MSYGPIDDMSEGTNGAKDAVMNGVGNAGNAARSAAKGIEQGVKDLFLSKGTDININWEPFYWKSEKNLTERIQLINSEMEPWNEFASAKGLNFPPGLKRVKARYSENINKYFYNYLALALADLAISGVLHQMDAVITFALVVLLYVAFEDDIPLFGNFYIGSRIKGIIVGLAFIVTFFTGGVFSFILHSIFFGITVFIVHAFFRQTTEMDEKDEQEAAELGASEETPLAPDTV